MGNHEQPKIQISGLTLEYVGAAGKDVPVVIDLNLSVREGEMLTVVGPSGCGKSTLLHYIAGLLPKTAVRLGRGTIQIKWNNAERLQRLGYVFQHDTLLPWFSVLENVELGLRVQGMPLKQRREIAQRWIHMVGLDGSEHAYPHALSGGMRQRVNIIRTLAYDPEIILMDEPFGALDAQTRMGLQQTLLDLWRATGKTILFVTHDIEESVALGQRVVLFGPRPKGIVKSYDIPMHGKGTLGESRYAPESQEMARRIWEDLRSTVDGTELPTSHGSAETRLKINAAR